MVLRPIEAGLTKEGLGDVHYTWQRIALPAEEYRSLYLTGKTV